MSLKLNGKSITKKQITQLQREAGMVGDSQQYVICEMALAGNRKALTECARVINEVREIEHLSDIRRHGK